MIRVNLDTMQDIIDAQALVKQLADDAQQSRNRMDHQGAGLLVKLEKALALAVALDTPIPNGHLPNGHPRRTA